MLFGDGNNGIVSKMKSGSTGILTAKIKLSEAREVGEVCRYRR